MNKIKVEHFENGLITFETENEFIEWTQMIFNENGDGVVLPKPTTVNQCKDYIEKYCGNFELIKTT